MVQLSDQLVDVLSVSISLLGIRQTNESYYYQIHNFLVEDLEEL
jgi:hypothetical protein